jgi:hypothetical protein
LMFSIVRLEQKGGQAWKAGGRSSVAALTRCCAKWINGRTTGISLGFTRLNIDTFRYYIIRGIRRVMYIYYLIV